MKINLKKPPVYSLFFVFLLLFRFNLINGIKEYNIFSIHLLERLLETKSDSLVEIIMWHSSHPTNSQILGEYPYDKLEDAFKYRSFALGFTKILNCGESCAIASLERVIEIDGNDFASLFLGFIYYGQGDSFKAISEWNTLEYAETVFLRMGTRAYYANDFNEALLFYEKADRLITEYESKHIQMLVATCIINRDRGNLERALDLCQKNVDVFQSSFSWLLLGRVQYEMGNYQHAIVSFKRAVDFAPQSAPGFRWLGDALVASGYIQDGQIAYMTSIGLDEKYGWNKLGLAKSYLQLGENEQATILLESLSNHPDLNIRRIVREELDKLILDESP